MRPPVSSGKSLAAARLFARVQAAECATSTRLPFYYFSLSDQDSVSLYFWRLPIWTTASLLSADDDPPPTPWGLMSCHSGSLLN